MAATTEISVPDDLEAIGASASELPRPAFEAMVSEAYPVGKEHGFRCMTVVQEAIFDTGCFVHVADAISRVKDRLQQPR